MPDRKKYFTRRRQDKRLETDAFERKRDGVMVHIGARDRGPGSPSFRHGGEGFYWRMGHRGWLRDYFEF